MRKIPNDFTTYYSKVDNGFDGLDVETINRLKPTPKEEKLIKKYKVKSVIYTFLLVLAVVIEFGIVLAFDLKLHYPLTYIVVIATFIVWWILEDTCRVEIHRLKSGYYKKTYGFVCQNCKNKVLINFNEIENYKDAPRNEQGIRVIPCRVCNHLVPMYNFDSSYKEYKKYSERIR